VATVSWVLDAHSPPWQILWHPTRSQRVRFLVSRLVRGNRLGFSRRRVEGREYLDVGCGTKVNDTFIGLDFYWHPALDVCHDATRGLPFDNASMKGVFTEHCLEHLELNDVDALLADVMRVLRPGGTVRIIVPDAELYARRYVALQDGADGPALPYSEIDGLDGIYTPAMSLNRVYTSWGHRFIFDFDTLRAMLARHDFVRISRESFRSGRDATLLQDSEEHVVESLYVEASKP
jgi:predicted SAM-dependent methyltransferase